MLSRILAIEVAKASAKLVVAGFIIGLLHRHDGIIAGILISYIAWKWRSELMPKGKLHAILFSGMVCTGILGSLAELWGIHHGHWVYHDLSEGRSFPYWLPLAWALSFYYMYRLERTLLADQTPPLFIKFSIFLLVALIFPVIGEIVTIALGVWDYRWPYQFCGVPLIAMVYLIGLHMSVNAIFMLLCYIFHIHDPVFALRTSVK